MEEKGSLFLYETQDEGEDLHENNPQQNESPRIKGSLARYRKKNQERICRRSLCTFLRECMEEMCKIVQSWFSSGSSTPDRLVIKIPRNSLEELEYDNI